ncbi:hypothetical protein [Sorangium sp. So ce1024]|uniref:hypothetical protein n=1 Tax=Sorangium sp. So ce1024 TaxID=3133327 RepID=UPI003EFBE69D
MKMRALSRCLAGLGVVAVSGCGLVLGLNDFEDAAPADGATSTGTGAGGAGGAGGGATCEPESEVACYSGPSGTKDVGICRAGTQVCKQDGSGYEACSGEVTPAVETCASTEDEDCDGKDCVVWAVSFGDESLQTARAIAVDSSGNSYVVGTFDGDIAVGETVLTSLGSNDIFLIKFAADGALVWAKGFGSVDAQLPSAIAVDGEGNVFFSGITAGRFELGEVSIERGMFLAMVDSLGNPVWARRLSGLCSLETPGVNSIVATGDNALIIAGTFCEAIDLGGDTLLSTGTRTDVFVAKLRASDGSGAATSGSWGKVFGDAERQYGRRVALDNEGRIVLVGEYRGSVDFGLGSLRAAEGQDIFVARFESDGTASSQRRVGGTGDDFVGGVALDSVGGVLLSGSFDGSIDVGGGRFDAADRDRDGFLLKMTSGGGYQWSLWMSGEGHQLGQNVAIGSDGDVYVQGEFEGTVKFGSAELISADEHGSLFVARLSRVGQLSWSRKIDGFSDRRWAGMALTSSGEPVLLGSFSGIVELGASTLTTNGGSDVFLAKLVP